MGSNGKVSRLEKAAKAKALRDEGLTWKQVGARMGLAKTTVQDLVADPSGEKARARKAQYRAPCAECGALTNPGGLPSPGAVSTGVCLACLSWTPEEIIAAFVAYADRHGGIPPTAAESTPVEGLPAMSTVAKRFGGWNRALRAAGFEVHMDRGPETLTAIRALVRAGVETQEIADAFGVGPNAIRMRFVYRGERLRRYRGKLPSA